jgi:hypothetical protein
MESYKRAIHTRGDSRLVWVLMGHTIPNKDGTSFICLGFDHVGGKLQKGKNIMQLSSTRRVRPVGA